MIRILGPKQSICCAIVSSFGIFFMGFLSLAFYLKSPALIEDLALPEDPTREQIFIAYSSAGMNCLITAIVYILTLGFAGWQIKVNSREGCLENVKESL